MNPQDVLKFWFEEISQEAWFKKDANFDEMIRQRFLKTYQAARADDLKSWQTTAEGSLALVIVLDQFPRNMFRDKPQAFATDAQALKISKQTIANGMDQTLPKTQRWFMYLPFMHSEDLADQERSIELFKALGNENSLKYAHDHHAIIKRFGRYPHRNEILGRRNTPEEEAFLREPGSSF